MYVPLEVLTYQNFNPTALNNKRKFSFLQTKKLYFRYKRFERGIPQQSSAQDLVLSLQWSRVQYSVKELRSCKSRGTAKRLFSTFFLFWPCCMACGILLSSLIQPPALATKTITVLETPRKSHISYKCIFLYPSFFNPGKLQTCYDATESMES